VVVAALVSSASLDAQGAARTDSSATGDSSRVRAQRLVPVVTVVRERPRAAPPPVPFIDVPRAALERAQAATAYDLVRRTAGLEIHEQGQGPGFTSNAVLRGFNSDHSADVLLVVDGVPINAAVHGHVEGFADWNLLVPGATEALRVIHGSASPLYGDFALAGVVEVFTAADAEGSRGGTSTSSFGDAGGWWQVGQRSATHGWALTLDGARAAGWQDHATSWRGNGVLRGWRTLGAGRLEGGLQSYGSRWDSPGFVSIARYNTNDLRRAVDTTDGGVARRTIAHARYARPLGRLWGRPLSAEVTAWHQRGVSDWYLAVPGEGAVVRQAREEDTRRATGGQLQTLLSLPSGQLMAGVSLRADAAEYLRDATLARVSTRRDHAYDAAYRAVGGFVRWQSVVGSRLFLDLGLRGDRLDYAITDLLTPLGRQRKQTLVMSPKVGAQYVLPWAPAGASLTLLASLSQGFRGAVGVIADPTRAPFLARSAETGLRLEAARTSVHLSVFSTRVDNERVFDATTLAVSSAGRSRRQGIDLRASMPVARAEHLRATLALTLNDARFLRLGADTGRVTPTPQTGIHDHNVPIVPGDPVPGVARYTGNIALEGRLPLRAGDGAGWRLGYRVLGPFTPVGEPGVTTQAASVLDLGASIALGRARQLGAVMLDVDLQNVLDLRYVENRASGFITPGAPQVLRVGVRFGASSAAHGPH
jgi:hypothetical protein